MTKYELDRMLEKLPIGYYAKREIGIESSITERTSYYDAAENKIMISLPIINEGLKNIARDDENAVRAMLYHEVSHAILTPSGDYVSWSDVMNVFEDERIETVLANFYMDVNFKQQVFAINGIKTAADIKKPADGWEYFYQVVRFRKGDKSELDRVNQLINKYANIVNSRDGYDEWDYYYHEVADLYDKCCRKYGFPKKQRDHYSSRDISNNNSITNSTKNSNTPIAGGEVDESLISDATATNVEPPKTGHGGRNGSDGEKNIFNPFNAMDSYIDIALTDTIKEIFRSFNSRQLNNGNAMNGYSGIFDPRSVLRDDYKYFIRNSCKGNGKGFSKFNLNLFIDCSGSYSNNEVKTNTIIRSLQEIEKENPTFSFTVTCMAIGEWRLPKEKRFIKADGCNQLDKNLVKLFNEVQRGDAVNYNIVLFDGWTGGQVWFKAFNNSNVSIISDGANQDAIICYAPKAKKIFVTDTTVSYADRLFNNILEILKVAFM